MLVMKTFTIMPIALLCVLFSATCRFPSSAGKDNNVSSSRTTLQLPQDLPNKDGESDKYYYVASVVRWDIDDRNTFVEAELETIKVLLDDLPTGLPFSRLVVRNFSTKATIYKQDFEDFPISMYTRDMNGDQHPELVLSLTGGGVANQLLFLSVTETQARIIFNESYRIDASMIDLGQGATDVLLTTGDSGVGPFYTTRYVWKGDRYEAVGRVLHERLINIVNRQFNEPR